MPIDPVLQFTNATVIREDRAVLHGLTLNIAVGEHTAIVGPNGAGKSSFVRLLTHEDRPLVPEDSNAPSPVKVFGSDNWDVFDLRSRLGLVSSDLHHKFVFGNNEGRVRAENAVLSGFFATQGILRYGTVTDEMRRRAAEALERMGATHLSRRWLDEMSSGEARRVLLARALVTSPRALVLDEPTTGLDLIARHSFMERVRQIAREGTTLILITHHIEEIIPEIGRVLLLRGGRIVADGPKRSVLTPHHLGSLFDAPVAIDEEDGYFYARPGGKNVGFGLWALGEALGSRLWAGGAKFAPAAVRRSMARDHRRLRVFHEAHQLVVEIYRETQRFPREEWFGICAQLRRAAVSVSSNLVEGSARRTLREYGNFVNIARGSAAEVGYLVALASELGYLPSGAGERLQDKCDHLIPQLESLMQKLDVLMKAERQSCPKPSPQGLRPRA